MESTRKLRARRAAERTLKKKQDADASIRNGGKGYSPGAVPRLKEYLSEMYKRTGWDEPDFLAPYSDALQVAVPTEHAAGPVSWESTGDLREVVAAPPQHGKTELTLRAFLYWAHYFPGLKHTYVTYNETRSRDVAKLFQRLAKAEGFIVEGNTDVVELTRANGTAHSERTFVKFSSVKGDLTGYALTGVGVVDDPIKNAVDASSAAVRKMCQAWYKSVLRTRRHPGTSLICMATRWHSEDLSGHLITAEGFNYINIKAIAELGPGELPGLGGIVTSDPLKRVEGASLWRRKPPEFFAEEMADLYWWAAMYQGNPRPEGGTVFKEPHYYTALPVEGFRVGWGIDLAYSQSNKADFSVLIRGVSTGSTLYITQMVRVQETILSLAPAIKKHCGADKGSPVRWYGAGQEKAIVQALRKDTGIRIKYYAARVDKFIRATPVAKSWNNGRVLLPADGPEWVSELLGEVLTFTGKGDTHDDIVDALAALYDEICKNGGTIGALMGENDQATA